MISPATVYRCAAAGLALFAMCACSSGGESSDGIAQKEGREAVGESGEEPHAGRAEQLPEGSGATLVQGRTTIYGLQIPFGMRPQQYLPRVYRFAGNNPVAHVATSVREQVMSAKTTREKGGYLLRGARVRQPQGSATGEERLAIRIAPGPDNGAVLDIWLEPKGRAAGDSSNRSPRTRLSRRHPVRQTSAAVNRRREARRATWRAMAKVSRGEPLTEEDKKSGFFD